MISKLKKLDLFGSKVEFNFAGQKRSSSCYGLSITFICLVVLLTTVYISGVDIVKKRNPLTITSELFFQDPEEMVITPDTFSFAFGLETPGSLDHFINESIYQVKVKHVTTQKVNGGADIRTTTYIGVERCTGSNFGALESKFSTLPLSQLYCLQINDTNIDELKLQGVYESSVYKIITISINKCRNSTTDPNAVQCGTPDEINKKLNGGYFAIYYPNLGIDLKNFGEPAVQNRDSYFTSVTGTYQKYGQMWLKHVELATDTGYLFEQLDIDNLIQMDTVRELTSYAENPTGIMTFDLRVEKIKTYYKRSYVKLQDIFADVDGMATLLVLITFFIVKPYADLKFNEGIINEVFDIKQEDPKKGDDDKQKKKRERIQRRLRSLDSALSPHERVEDHILNKQKTIGDTSIIRHTETIMVSEVPPVRDTFRNINLQTKTDEKDSSIFLKQNSVRTNKFSSRFPTVHIEPESADLNRQRTAVTELIKLNSVSTRVKPTRPQTLHLDHHLSDEHMTPKFDLLRLESPSLMSGVEKLERIDRKIVEDDLEEMGSKTIDEQLDEIKSEKGNNEEQNVEVQSPKDVLSERKYLTKEKASTKNNETKHTSNDKNEIRISIEDNLSALDEEESETQNQPKSVPKSNSNNNKSKCFGFTRKKDTQKIKISFLEFLLSFIWMPKGLKKKMDILEKGMKKVEKKLDIFSVLKNIREIEKLKILLLENDQLILFDNLPKPMLQLRDMKNTMSFSHYLLKKPTFDHFNMKGGINRKVLTSYRKLKNKALSTEIDLKLVHLYDEILNE